MVRSDAVNIDTILYTVLNPLSLWTGVLALLYVLPSPWGKTVLLVALVATGALTANTRYKRRGGWELLGPKDLALITGGSNGLGLALIKRLVDRGVRVINLDIEPMDIQKGDKVAYIKCDLGDEYQVLRALHEVKSKCGIPSLIINNAAIRQTERFENLSFEKIKHINQINILTPMTIIRFFIKDTKQRLHVTNISSILGMVSPSNLSIYSSTKASMISLHDTLTHEYTHSPSKRFLLVVPGQLNTRMFQDVKPPKAFFAPVLDSTELSKQIVRKIELGERGVLNGPIYTYFIPLLRMMPFSVVEFARWFSEMDVSIKEKDIDSLTD